MELSDAEDARNLLIKKKEIHKQELEADVKMLSESTEKLVTKALVIGGTLAVSYIIVRQITKSRKKKKARIIRQERHPDTEATYVASMPESRPGIVSQIGSALAAQATVFLLDLAKDKLASYLQGRPENQAVNPNERS